MITLVRWQRHRRGRAASPPSLLHIESDTLSDRYGRTGCGKRYPRKDVIEDYQTEDIPDDDDMCALCLTALESEPS